MATLTITITAGNNAGATFRRLASAIEQAASVLPDINSSGASVVMTIDNAPSGGTASVQLTAGPYQNSSAFIV